MMRYDPFDALMPLRETVNRLLAEGMLGVSRFEPIGRVFPLDIRDTDAEYIVEAAIPGFKMDDMHVTAAGNTITIQAAHQFETPAAKERKAEPAEKEDVYVRRERYLGEMSRVIELPTPIEAARITATYEHGVLTLRVPKAAKATPVQIPIQIKEPAALH
ncbi:MAG TPA: Hsp20/alpha crystallin family protein [Ktedonobacterales bacterium]|nr:Hsp20/alpha crystallin family protein [Ktedonobacterales bacterium]